MWLNQMVHSLVSIYFGSPQLSHTIKASCINIQTIDPEIGSILIFSLVIPTKLLILSLFKASLQAFFVKLQLILLT